MRGLGALLLALAAAQPACALAADDPPKAPDCPGLAAMPEGVSAPEDRRITCDFPGPWRLPVQQSEELGLRLRRHDLAAWLSTDALRALHAFDKPPEHPLGWLTREVDGGIEIRYYQQDAGEVRAFASAVLDDKTNAIRDARLLDPAVAADAYALRLLKARSTALAQPRLACTSNINTIILDEPDFDRISVYLFSAWDEQAAPMGGHSRFHVSADGTKLLDAFQQTGTCLNFASTPDPKAMILVSDRHSGPPSELQVFLQRQYDVPVVVRMTGDDSVWKIDGGQLYLLPAGDKLRESVLQAETTSLPGETK